MVRWWSDWKLYRTLPYGGSDINEQPEFVAQVLDTCAATEAQIIREREKKAERDLERQRREALRKNRGASWSPKGVR